PLSIERIVDTAFEVMASDGYEALTMRRLASQLGTGPASLYAHIDGKRDLDQLIVGRVSAQVQMPDPDPARWQEQVKKSLRDIRAVMARHPGVARAAMANVPTGEESLGTAEGLMAILRAGGVAEQVAAWACDLLPLYVTAVAFEESLYRVNGMEGQEEVGRLHAYFAALPADRFPHLVASAVALTTGGGDERFEFGLSVLVAGIAAMAAGGEPG
ncbi:MAG: TetR/AcrR family transcriptional regulator, partial [Nocardioidaceae bacterium]